MLEYRPGSFRLVRHVRPKLVCRRCERIVQSEAPSRPIARGLAGPGLLAHVLVAKYADHLPLYRKSEIYAREGVALDRSTLAGWVGGVCALLQPLDEALAKETFTAGKLHTDDTPVPVLAPGHGKTRTGRLWVYVRDDRTAGDSTPPMVLFRYSADRKGERPRAHLQSFKGFLQADGYAGYSRLYGNAIVEVACWAHVRRKFHDEYVDKGSELARQALERIGLLYDIETAIRGRQPAERQAVRQARAGPLLEELRQWLDTTLRRVPGRSGLPLPSVTPGRVGNSSVAIVTTAGWRSTTALLNALCGAWLLAARTGCSPDPMPAANVLLLSIASSRPASLTVSIQRPISATSLPSSQFTRSTASPSSSPGTSATSSQTIRQQLPQLDHWAFGPRLRCRNRVGVTCAHDPRVIVRHASH
jgi:transposase